MKTIVLHFVFGLVMGAPCATPVLAGAWEDALAAYQEGRFDAEIKMLRPLAEAGNTDAVDTLSDIYWYGEGVPVDYVEALTWARGGAALGSAEGENKRRRQASPPFPGASPQQPLRFLPDRCWQQQASVGRCSSQVG